jgi:hypothetical protein
MSSSSSIHLRKQSTQPNRYSLTASCTKHSLTFNSAAPSSISKNEKEDSPKNSGAFNNPSENNLQRGYSSTSYAQTPSAYSQYQTIYLSELPAPHSWPSENAIPSQEQMDYDLLGLSYQTPSCSQYLAIFQQQGIKCPYHETFLGSGAEASQVGKGLSVMDRWMLEDESESGVMFAREDTEKMITDRGCRCAMVVGPGLQMANLEES